LTDRMGLVVVHGPVDGWDFLIILGPPFIISVRSPIILRNG
jgi:hypothetical protein